MIIESLAQLSFARIALPGQEIKWVVGPIFIPNFKVEVGTRRTAGGSHYGNMGAFADPLPLLDQVLFIMGVGGEKAILMLNDDKLAITTQTSRKNHAPGCRCLDRISEVAINIDPVVKTTFPGTIK